MPRAGGADGAALPGPPAGGPPPSWRRRLLTAVNGNSWRTVAEAAGGNRRIVAIAILSMVSGVLEAGLLLLVVRMGTLVAGSRNAATSVGPLLEDLSVSDALWIAVVAALVLAVCRVVAVQQGAIVVGRVLERTRRRLFDAYVRAAWETQSTDRAGHFQELVTSHATRVGFASGVYSQSLAALLNLLTLSVVAIVISPIGAVVVIAAMPLLFLAVVPLLRRGRRLVHRQLRLEERFASDIADWVAANQEIGTYGVQDPVSRAGQRSASAITPLTVRARFMNQTGPEVAKSAALLLLAIGLAAVDALDVGRIGALGAVVVLLVRAIAYAQQLQRSQATFNELLPYFDRIEDEIRRYRAAAVVGGSGTVGALETLELDHVLFRYQGDRGGVTDVSGTIRANEMLGIAGVSGSGKSTLGRLVLGLLTPSGGAVTVNGVALGDLDRAVWSRKVGVVEQEPHLIPGTVRENIVFFRDGIDEDTVAWAARLAGIHDEVAALPRGYDTPAAGPQGGLSGGQRQRVCLARALAGRPELLVLDEPTSALDERSAQAVNAALDMLRHETTVLVITHSAGTLLRCDRVWWIDDGRKVADGPPEEVVARMAESVSGPGRNGPKTAADTTRTEQQER